MNQIFTYISQGLTSKEIAQKMHLSKKTIDRKVEKFCKAKGYRTRSHAVAELIKDGSIK